MRYRALQNPPAIRGMIDFCRQSLIADIGTKSVNTAAAQANPIFISDALLAWVDRRRLWIGAVVLVMYLAGFNGQWRMQPDAALYLSIGRNLAEGNGFTYLGEENHVAYPGWPGVIAIVMKIFGTRSVLPINIAEIFAFVSQGYENS